jgi:hypothetical protein
MKMHCFLSQVAPVVAAAVLASNTLQPSRAHACSTTAPIPDFDQGEPRDNATDVPTDVVLYYPMPVGPVSEGDAVPGVFALRTAGGIDVAITARRAGAWGYELVPAELLAPNTEYVLTGSWTTANAEALEDTQRFTTGAGPLQATPPAPTATLEHYRIVQTPLSSCSPQETGSCVSFGDPELMIEVRHIDEFDQLDMPYLVRGAMLTNLSGIEQGTSFRCVRLRTRAANGTYGDPQTLCGAEASLTEVMTENVACTSAGLTAAGVPVARDVEDAGDVSHVDAGGTVEPIGGAASTGTPDAGMLGAPRVDGTDEQADDGAAEEPTAPAASSSSCSVSHARNTDASTHPASWLLAISAMLVLARRRRA